MAGPLPFFSALPGQGSAAAALKIDRAAPLFWGSTHVAVYPRRRSLDRAGGPWAYSERHQVDGHRAAEPLTKIAAGRLQREQHLLGEANRFLFHRIRLYSDVPEQIYYLGARSFTAMWLIARKRIESWRYRIVVNVIGITCVKDVKFVALLYVILLVWAVCGLYLWLRAETPRAAELA